MPLVCLIQSMEESDAICILTWPAFCPHQNVRQMPNTGRGRGNPRPWFPQQQAEGSSRALASVGYHWSLQWHSRTWVELQFHHLPVNYQIPTWMRTVKSLWKQNTQASTTSHLWHTTYQQHFQGDRGKDWMQGNATDITNGQLHKQHKQDLSEETAQLQPWNILAA